jgi:hypothetical protein
MMTPGQASAQGNILLINHPAGGWRKAAHVFDLADGGIAYIDQGWTDPLFSGHACHILPGTVSETPGYPGWFLVGEHDISIETGPGEPDGDREFAREILERDLDMTLAK